MRRSIAAAFAKASGNVAGTDVSHLITKSFAAARAEGADIESIIASTAREIGALFAKAWAEVTVLTTVEENGAMVVDTRTSAKAAAMTFGRAIAGGLSNAVNRQDSDYNTIEANEVASMIVRATATVGTQLETSTCLSDSTSRAAAKAVADLVVALIGEAIASRAGGPSNSSFRPADSVSLDTKELPMLV